MRVRGPNALREIYLQVIQGHQENSMGTFIPGAAKATADLGLNQMMSADLELSASDSEKAERSSNNREHGNKSAMDRALRISLVSQVIHVRHLVPELGNGHHLVSCA